MPGRTQAGDVTGSGKHRSDPNRHPSSIPAINYQPPRAVVAAAGGQGDFRDPGTTPTAVDQAWSDALRKNLFSAVLPIEALLPRMLDNDGRIVLIGSTAGLDGAGGPYASAKAALAGYGRDLATREPGNGVSPPTRSLPASLPTPDSSTPAATEN